MIINFKKVSAKNFLSLGDVSVDLSDQGLVYVKGKNKAPGSSNSNGAGKSSIFEAIFYALTGNTLRGTSNVVNKYSDSDVVDVVLEFDMDGSSYKVERTRNHPDYGNNLKIWKDDTDISGDKLRKSESVLANEMGLIDYSLVSNVIILGQGLPNKFTSLSPAGRKDRLETLSQSTEFIDELGVRLNNFNKSYEVKQTNQKIAIATKKNEESLLQSSLQSSSKELSELTNSPKSNVEELEKEKVDLTSKLDKKNKEVKTYTDMSNKLYDQLNIIRNSLNSCESKLNSNQYELKRNNTYIQNLNVKKCPTCGQYINSPEKISALKEEALNTVNKLNSQVELLNKKIITFKNQNSIVEEKSRKLREITTKIQQEISTISIRIKEIDLESKSVQDKIDKLNNTLEEINKKISLIEQDLDKMSKELNTTNSKLEVLDYIKKISARDFRGYLLKGVIDYLNNKLSYYSKELFGLDKLILILDGNKLFIEYDGRPYENLSGGEKQRADLAMQFSLRDMLINSLGFSCNILVIDEGFDNLDDSGVNSLLKVINNFKGIDSVFTISHHTLSIPFDTELNVVKGIDNITYIE